MSVLRKAALTIAAFLWLPFQPAQADVLTYVGCAGQSAEYTLTFHGSIVLNWRFLDPGRPIKAQLTDAIRQQLRYIEGHWHNSQKPGSEQALVLSEDSLKIENIKFRDSAYGFNLNIDNIEHPEFKLEEPYLERAVTLGNAQASDSAVRAEYTASVQTIACAPAGAEVRPTVKLALPLDPYLFYWLVAPAHRRPIRWRQSFFRVNPCADPEIADLPNPMAYWYFWNPAQSGVDADGKTFTCASLLHQGKDFITIDGNLTARKAIKDQGGIFAFDRLPTNRPLRTTALWGIIDPKAETLPVKKLSDTLNALAPPVRAHGINAALKQLGFGPERRSASEVDRGSMYFADFLRGLPEVFNITGITTQVDRDTFLADIKGKLGGSGRELILKISFGPTDVLSKPEPQHWNTLAAALANDDIVLYNGHSGLGENTSIKSLTHATQKKPGAFNGPPYQIVAFLSCYSYSYFGSDLVTLRSKAPRKGVTDIVYTGIDFTSERGALGLLDFLDRSIQAKNPHSANFTAGHYLSARDFFIVKRY